MTEKHHRSPEQPRPVGDPVRAFRQALARAHRAEAENRRLKARLHEMEDQ